jgi:hypothetical protein
MSRALVFCCIVAFAFALVVVGGAVMPTTRPAGAAATHTIHGTVVVRGGVSLEDCAGADDQSDIHQGTRIRLQDDDHHVVARARLGVGRAGGGGIERCLFRFSMPDVPSSPTYTFLVADRNDGRTVTRTRLAGHDWRVTLKP